MERLKGVTAFAIYFVVFGILLFITAISYLLYYSLISTGIIQTPADVGDFGLSEYAAPTILDWSISSVSLLGSISLFFAGFFILRNKQHLKILISASFILIVKNILKIMEDFRAIFGVGESAYSIFGAYASTWGIAVAIFSILFWIFVIWFFSRGSIQSQFG